MDDFRVILYFFKAIGLMIIVFGFIYKKVHDARFEKEYREEMSLSAEDRQKRSEQNKIATG